MLCNQSGFLVMDEDLRTADYFYCVNFDILLFFFLYRIMKKQKLLTCFFKSKSSNAQHEDSNSSTSYKRLDDSKTADDEEQPPLEFSAENASNEKKTRQFHQPQIFHFTRLRHLNCQNQSVESKIDHVNPVGSIRIHGCIIELETIAYFVTYVQNTN